MKLCQNLATLKATKSRINRKVTDLHHTTKTPGFFHGQVRTFEAINDRVGESPPEYQRVQFRAEDILKSVGSAMTELMDATAIQEWANTDARADVKVGGETLLEGVPVTYLLFLKMDDERRKIGSSFEMSWRLSIVTTQVTQINIF